MESLLTTSLLAIVKFFLWTLLLLFVVFAAIVVRQVQLMNRVLSVPISGGLRALALGFLLVAVAVFVVSLVVL